METFPGLAGKVVFITGGARGIGAALGRGFADEGAKVALADLDLEAGLATAAQIGEAAVAMCCDVTNRGSIAAAMEEAVRQFGGIDILVNNAGRHQFDVNLPPTQLSPEKWRSILDVNVMGVVNASFCALPFLRKRGGGVILNLGSYSGYVVDTAYGVTKLAVRGLTVAMAQELGPDNIRVNAMAPGLIASETIRQDVPQTVQDHFVGKVQLIKRLGVPEDLVGLAKFLCSSLSNFMTGETVLISGGAGIQV